MRKIIWIWMMIILVMFRIGLLRRSIWRRLFKSWGGKFRRIIRLLGSIRRCWRRLRGMGKGKGLGFSWGLGKVNEVLMLIFLYNYCLSIIIQISNKYHSLRTPRLLLPFDQTLQIILLQQLPYISLPIQNKSQPHNQLRKTLSTINNNSSNPITFQNNFLNHFLPRLILPKTIMWTLYLKCKIFTFILY